MKIILTKYDNDLVTVDTLHNMVYVYSPSDMTFTKYFETKVELPIKIELHLRNSEAVMIPVLVGSQLQHISLDTLDSHSIWNPVRGTHDPLIVHFKYKGDSTQVFKKGDQLIAFKVVSYHYWKLLLRKDVEGLLSVPIQIELK